MAVFKLSQIVGSFDLSSNPAQVDINGSDLGFGFVNPTNAVLFNSSNGPIALYKQLTLVGTGLSMTPPLGPDTLNTPIGSRIATGTVTELTYSIGSPALRASIVQFTISNLQVSAADMLRNVANLTSFLLSGNDTVFGNDAANVLNGYAGNDVIFGYGGNDTLIGGDGNDTLDGGTGTDILVGGNGNDILLPGITFLQTGLDQVDGGAGTDTISFAGKVTGVQVDLTTGSATDLPINNFGQIQTPVTILNVENATGGNGDDLLIGNAGVNVLSGGAGNDTLRGGAGRDTLDGGAGSDTADYSDKSTAITINLTTGVAPDADRLISIENVIGTALNDTMTGNAEANRFDGGSGNDQIFGLAGNDTLNGQDGDDALFGGLGNDIIGGGFGNGGLFGEAGNDQIYGGEGNDYIEGGDGDDVIWGQLGNDQIIAGAGNDFAVLGEGDDFFRLGAGNDRLRFDYDNGKDTVADFNLGNDVIDFTFTDMTRDVLVANAIETTQGVLLNLGSGSILLAGLTWGQIDWAGSGDFIFA